MIKFTEHFYAFKKMILDKNIPIEFRARYIIDKSLANSWKKLYNYNMFTDDEFDTLFNSTHGRSKWWENCLGYQLRNLSVKNISSIMDMDFKHPEITPSDLAIALILWGRGPAILKTLVSLNEDMPEYDEFINLLAKAKELKKMKKSLPPITHWYFH